jgi:t-SNARE complex subunit (syntaxin)
MYSRRRARGGDRQFGGTVDTAVHANRTRTHPRGDFTFDIRILIVVIIVVVVVVIVLVVVIIIIADSARPHRGS